jgi:hypothetical protein
MTFQILASFAGHGEPLGTSVTKSTEKTKAPTVAKTKSNGPSATETANGLGEGQPSRDFGLTVRVEVNLPAGGDQETYDKIFRSIRQNLFPNVK